jgi:hypothetical protein
MTTEEHARNRLIALARGLVERTVSGQIEWREVVPANAFQLDIPSGAIVIETVDSDESPPYRMTIHNPEGQEVDALEQEWEAYEGESYPADWNVTLADLFEAARRNALDIDSVLNGIIQDLGLET